MFLCLFNQQNSKWSCECVDSLSRWWTMTLTGHVSKVINKSKVSNNFILVGIGSRSPWKIRRIDVGKAGSLRSVLLVINCNCLFLYKLFFISKMSYTECCFMLTTALQFFWVPAYFLKPMHLDQIRYVFSSKPWFPWSCEKWQFFFLTNVPLFTNVEHTAHLHNLVRILFHQTL